MGECFIQSFVIRPALALGLLTLTAQNITWAEGWYRTDFGRSIGH